MILKFDVKYGVDISTLSDSCRAAEKVLAYQIMKDTRPYVPALNGFFSNATRVIGNNIVYSGVQARYLYEGVAMVDSVTGKGAFYIPEVGFRFHKGATLVPTSRPLNYTKTMHPQATDHWFEHSKKQNMEKWLRVADKAVKNGL